MEFAKYAKYTLYGIMGISAIFILWFFFGGVTNPGAIVIEPIATGSFLKFSYVLAFVAIVSTLGFSVFNTVSDMKKVKNVAILIVIVAVLVAIARIFSSGEVLKMIGYTGEENVPHILKNVDTGIYVTYILIGATIVAILYSEIAKLFK